MRDLDVNAARKAGNANHEGKGGNLQKPGGEACAAPLRLQQNDPNSEQGQRVKSVIMLAGREDALCIGAYGIAKGVRANCPGCNRQAA